MSDGENASVAAASPQCQFFVQRKKRLCRMTVKPGRQYCGEHQPQPDTQAGQEDKRIPCPNDPKHTCYASKLLKHLAICNARLTEQPPYIIHNINAPEAVDSCPRLPLSSYPKDALANVIDKVNYLYAKHIEGQIPTEPAQAIHRAVSPQFKEADRAESSRRHLRQVSALLWAAELAGLAVPRACYVELGAGKGQLSYYAAHAWCAGTGSRVLCVDRAPLRHKRDNKLRSAPPTTTQHNDNDTHDVNDDTKLDKLRHKRDKLRPASPTPTQHSDTNIQNINDDIRIETDTLKDWESNDQIKGDIIVNKIDQIDTDNTNDSSIHNSKRFKSDKISSEDRSDVTAKTKDRHDGENEAIGEKESEIADITAKTKDDGDSEVKEETKSKKSKDNKAESKDKKESDSLNSEIGEGKESDIAVRIRADLAHLALEAVPVVAACDEVVGLAKHLCGVATDYALRCIAAPGVVSKTRGLVLATCCHHRIERNLYVANEHLQELGINAEEFNIMLGIVSWATCGDGRSRERRLRDTRAPAGGRGTGGERGAGGRQEEREQAGRRAKAIFDWGRVLWLRARGFDARLGYYVPRDVSLENVAIVAVKR